MMGGASSSPMVSHHCQGSMRVYHHNDGQQPRTSRQKEWSGLIAVEADELKDGVFYLAVHGRRSGEQGHRVTVSRNNLCGLESGIYTLHGDSTENSAPGDGGGKKNYLAVVCTHLTCILTSPDQTSLDALKNALSAKLEFEKCWTVSTTHSKTERYLLLLTRDRLSVATRERHLVLHTWSVCACTTRVTGATENTNSDMLTITAGSLDGNQTTGGATEAGWTFYTDRASRIQGRITQVRSQHRCGSCPSPDAPPPLPPKTRADTQHVHDGETSRKVVRRQDSDAQIRTDTVPRVLPGLPQHVHDGETSRKVVRRQDSDAQIRTDTVPRVLPGLPQQVHDSESIHEGSEYDDTMTFVKQPLPETPPTRPKRPAHLDIDTSVKTKPLPIPRTPLARTGGQCPGTLKHAQGGLSTSPASSHSGLSPASSSPCPASPRSPLFHLGPLQRQDSEAIYAEVDDVFHKLHTTTEYLTMPYQAGDGGGETPPRPPRAPQERRLTQNLTLNLTLNLNKLARLKAGRRYLQRAVRTGSRRAHQDRPDQPRPPPVCSSPGSPGSPVQEDVIDISSTLDAMLRNPSGFVSEDTLQLTQSERKKLCFSLYSCNPETPNDWTIFAEKIGLDHYGVSLVRGIVLNHWTPYTAGEIVLVHWQYMYSRHYGSETYTCPEPCTRPGLVALLRLIERLDLVHMLQGTDV